MKELNHENLVAFFEKHNTYSFYEKDAIDFFEPKTELEKDSLFKFFRNQKPFIKENLRWIGSVLYRLSPIFLAYREAESNRTQKICKDQMSPFEKTISSILGLGSFDIGFFDEEFERWNKIIGLNGDNIASEYKEIYSGDLDMNTFILSLYYAVKGRVRYHISWDFNYDYLDQILEKHDEYLFLNCCATTFPEWWHCDTKEEVEQWFLDEAVSEGYLVKIEDADGLFEYRDKEEYDDECEALELDSQEHINESTENYGQDA